MMQLMQAVCSLVHIFNKYAGKDGDCKTLTKNELSELLHKELVAEPSNKEEVEEFFKALDNDGDGTVDFQEYVIFVITLCLIYKPQ